MRVFPETTYLESLTYLYRIRHMHQELRHVREHADERLLLLPFGRETLHALLEPLGDIKSPSGPMANPEGAFNLLSMMVRALSLPCGALAGMSKARMLPVPAAPM